MALTREFEVRHPPALFLYREGVYHCPLQSEAGPVKLKQAIQTALETPAQDPP